MEPDVDLGDYIQLPDVNNYDDLMSNDSFENIRFQFLEDINTLKERIHFFVNTQHDENIDVFYKNIEENSEGFHMGLFLLYKETRCHLRCLIVKLDICQNDEIMKNDLLIAVNQWISRSPEILMSFLR
jgi:hypothetical protein